MRECTLAGAAFGAVLARVLWDSGPCTWTDHR